MDPVFPPELRQFRPLVEQYVQARVQVFAHMFAHRLGVQITPEQVDYLVHDTQSTMAQMQEPVQQLPQQNLRLVLRHDCQSSGCGDAGCSLCQYNPSRICKRNLKQKYLIDDHLRAKCGAPLRVEVVDESGRCMEEGLPDVQLEVHVLNGEKYKEVCPDNTLLTTSQLRQCVIVPNHKKPLLRRDGTTDDAARLLMAIENGYAPLSELACTTSSEALLAGKAPTFRLLVWAVDVHGVHLPGVTYVVSENFVVATKRVKHAIKSDIPCIGDQISKLVHVGKATVDKLANLRQAACEENLEVDVPDELNRVETVGQFQKLVELTEVNADLKHKLRHLLKLSPEKWDEVAQHALAAVVPDFRPRVWWNPGVNGGLLFGCKNGAILMDAPIALVTRGSAEGQDQVAAVHTLEAAVHNVLPRLKQQALQDWYAPGHVGWSVYWSDPNDPLAQQMQPGAPNGATMLAQGVFAAAAAGAASQLAAAHGGGGGAQLSPNGTPMAASPQGGMLSPQLGAGMGMGGMQAPPPISIVGNGHHSGRSPSLAGSGAMGPGGGYGHSGATPGMPYQPGHASHSGVSPQHASPHLQHASPAASQQQTLPSLQQQQQQHQHQQHLVQQHNQQQHLQQQEHLQQQQQQQHHHQQQQHHHQQQQHHLHQQFQQQQHQQQQRMSSGGGGMPPPGHNTSSGGGGGSASRTPHSAGSSGTGRSPFATPRLQASVSNAFPPWVAVNGGAGSGGGGPQNGGTPGGPTAMHMQPPGGDSKAAQPLDQVLPSLEMINTDDLPPMDRGNSLFSLNSLTEMHTLSDLPSIGVSHLLAGGDSANQHLLHLPPGHEHTGLGGAPLGGDGQVQGMDRSLSLKFSMSLDLAEIPSETVNG